MFNIFKTRTQPSEKADLNTSHVNVQYTPTVYEIDDVPNLNTSHVNVQSIT